jgi:hypothetical protein
VIRSRRVLGLSILAALLAASALAGCGSDGSSVDRQPGSPTASGTAAPSSDGTGAGGTPSPGGTRPPTIVEPTTTNTLPPPPEPTKPAPTRAGPLTATSLPVPRSWRTVVRAGGPEEGYQGNGTWVHGRDPRYAALDVISIGCAAVTRDDYRDPVHALEGTYRSSAGAPGIGLVLEFSGPDTAAGFFDLYRDQVVACQKTDDPVRTTIVPSSAGLIDRRRYPDGDWTEVAKISGARLTMIILSDPGHKITIGAAEQLLDQIR